MSNDNNDMPPQTPSATATMPIATSPNAIANAAPPSAIASPVATSPGIQASETALSNPLQTPDAETTHAIASPTAPLDPGMPIWHVGSGTPVFGHIAHDEVTDAIASGQYSFDKSKPVDVLNPDGVLGTLAPHDAPEAFRNGYKYATPQDIRAIKYGTAGQTAIGVAEAMGRGLAGPLATGAEAMLGVSPEGISGRKESLGLSGTAIEMGTMLAPALISGGSSLAARAGISGAEAIGNAAKAVDAYSQMGVLSSIGKASAKALGMDAAVTPLAKIGSTALKASIETGLFNAGDTVSSMILGEPHESLGMAAIDGGLLGLVVGGAFGAAGVGASKLWHAAKGSETGKLLGSIVDHAGGIESAASNDAIGRAIEVSGVDVPPAVRSALSNDPYLRNTFSSLSQGASNKSEMEVAAINTKFRNDVSNHLIESMGMKSGEAERIASSGFDKYTQGKGIGDVLASEFKAKLDPSVSVFERHKAAHANSSLEPSIASKLEPGRVTLGRLSEQLDGSAKGLRRAMERGDVEAAMEAHGSIGDTQAKMAGVQAHMNSAGSVDKMADSIHRLAEAEGWSMHPDSDIMKQVSKVIKNFENVKTVGDLTKYITGVRENMASSLPFGQADAMSRAGGKITSIMKEHEADMIERLAGKGGGERAVAELKAARDSYRKASQLKDIIDDHLSLHGSTGGYSKSVREMALRDGEGIARRLADKNDAHWLETMSKELPQTAEAVKQYHLQSALDSAVKKAKGENLISAGALRKSVETMSPQMRAFVMSPEALAKVDALGQILDHLDAVPHNFSNTARTMSQMMGRIPGAAVGLVASVITHNPLIGGLVGGLTKAIGKDAPDAAKLALLKFMGSDTPVNSKAFKAMVDFIHGAQRGEIALSRGVKNVLKGPDADVMSASMRPSEKDLAKLDKKLKEFQDHPERLLDSGGDLGHYMPEHASALGSMSANAVEYLNSLRPVEKPGITGGKAAAPSAADKARFNRALTIAQQPLSVLENLKKGNLTSHDVITLSTVYPDLHKSMSTKLIEEIGAAKGNVPYKTKIGLSLFLGQPMDASLSQHSIMMAQPTPRMPDQQAPGVGGQQPPSSKKMEGLNKLPKAYMTPEQSADSRRNKD